eukprot:6390568-Alexandrium_andersonii.AAC.1
MSASLVGSEMCIRDRGNSTKAQTPRHCATRTKRSAREGQRPIAQGQRPVSYTHLTLPTICSV